MQQFDSLLPGNFYHIYNHAVGGRNLFGEPDNYEYFLFLYDKHISPVADTYSWVLMPNHFHLLVRIKDDIATATDASNLTGFQNLSGLKPPHQHFSNLFNAYTKALNKRLNCRGALFERPFKRKLINSRGYLKKAVLYIHDNPIHHGFCKHPLEYPWSSYPTFLSHKRTKLNRDDVLEWFGDLPGFKNSHHEELDIRSMDKWLGMKTSHRMKTEKEQ
jgi:putative transposase